ncbi:hypothetical protein B0A48_06009 [Cryoendolithus antarcticus]|uniref:Uncharacterized protein n=1 Tax=Cryoendolithus antarcticus TaxID=1507870 RepID=A0A1V8TCY8_9PEZI|nr:hypothetical protein B0A48_06009 [Cryoendolithus antarcticus]
MAPPQPQQLIAPCYFLQIPPEMRLRIYDSTLDALDVLDLLRTSEWLSEAKSVTLRLDHQAPFTRGTHDMLTAFATIRTACPITLVLQRNHGKDGRVAVHKATGGCEELVRMITDIENRPGHHGFMAPDDNDDWADDVSGISTDDSWTYPFMAQIPNDCLNNSDCRRERCGQVAYRDEYGIMLGEEFDYREVDYDGNITANGYDPESYEGWSMSPDARALMYARHDYYDTLDEWRSSTHDDVQQRNGGRDVDARNEQHDRSDGIEEWEQRLEQRICDKIMGRLGSEKWEDKVANRIGIKVLGRLQLMINDEGELKIKQPKE